MTAADVIDGVLGDIRLAIRRGLGTYGPLDRHQALVCLSLFGVGDDLPRAERIEPSTHETALFRFLGTCDADNLTKMRRVYPDAVRAFAVWSFDPDGVTRLRVVARGGRDPGPADEPFDVPPATMWEMLDRRREAATGHPWSEVAARTADLIAGHRLFPRLVKAAAAAELPRPVWSRWHESRTYAGWLTRGYDANLRGAPRGFLTRGRADRAMRAMRIAEFITADLALDPRVEPDAAAYVLAREFVRCRESGRRPAGP